MTTASSAADASQGAAPVEDQLLEGATPPNGEGQKVDANPPVAENSSGSDKKTDANEGPKTLAEAVKAAAEAGKGDGKSSTPGAKEGSEAKTEADAEKPAGEKPEGEARTRTRISPFHNHPRWKESPCGA
jgi:hypothetical protein